MVCAKESDLFVQTCKDKDRTASHRLVLIIVTALGKKRAAALLNFLQQPAIPKVAGANMATMLKNKISAHKQTLEIQGSA